MTFENSDKLISKLLEKVPEIVFLDYRLPESKFKNGSDILVYLKSLYPKTEFVMYSAQDDINVATDTIRNGAYDYIVKSRTAIYKADIVVENIVEKNQLKFEKKQYKIFTLCLICFLMIFASSVFFCGSLIDRWIQVINATLVKTINFCSNISFAIF